MAQVDLSGPRALAHLIQTASEGYSRGQSMLIDLAQRKYQREAIQTATGTYFSAIDKAASIQDVLKGGTAALTMLSPLLSSPDAQQAAQNIRADMTIRTQALDKSVTLEDMLRSKEITPEKYMLYKHGDLSSNITREIRNKETGKDEVVLFNVPKGTTKPASQTVLGLAPESPLTPPQTHKENLKTDTLDTYAKQLGDIRSQIKMIGGQDEFSDSMKKILAEPQMASDFNNMDSNQWLSLYAEKVDPKTAARIGTIQGTYKNIVSLGGTKQRLRQYKDIKPETYKDEFEAFMPGTSPVNPPSAPAATDFQEYTLPGGRKVRVRKMEMK